MKKAVLFLLLFALVLPLTSCLMRDEPPAKPASAETAPTEEETTAPPPGETRLIFSEGDTEATFRYHLEIPGAPLLFTVRNRALLVKDEKSGEKVCVADWGKTILHTDLDGDGIPEICAYCRSDDSSSLKKGRLVVYDAVTGLCPVLGEGAAVDGVVAELRDGRLWVKTLFPAMLLSSVVPDDKIIDGMVVMSEGFLVLTESRTLALDQEWSRKNAKAEQVKAEDIAILGAGPSDHLAIEALVNSSSVLPRLIRIEKSEHAPFGYWCKGRGEAVRFCSQVLPGKGYAVLEDRYGDSWRGERLTVFFKEDSIACLITDRSGDERENVDFFFFLLQPNGKPELKTDERGCRSLTADITPAEFYEKTGKKILFSLQEIRADGETGTNFVANYAVSAGGEVLDHISAAGPVVALALTDPDGAGKYEARLVMPRLTASFTRFVTVDREGNVSENDDLVGIEDPAFALGEADLCLLFSYRGGHFSEPVYSGAYTVRHPASDRFDEPARIQTVTEGAPADPARVVLWRDFSVVDYPWSERPVYEISLAEFPAATFVWDTGECSISVKTAGETKKIVTGMPIVNAYFADLNGDGCRELCVSLYFGSGMVDEHIFVYDHVRNAESVLWDRGVWDYALTLVSGTLYAVKTPYDRSSAKQPESGPLVFDENGKLAIGTAAV